jgi:transposase
MDVREILRQIRAGESDRAIGRTLKINRATVKKYREWAQSEGLLEGELPPIEDLQARLATSRSDQRPPQNVSSVESYREQVVQWRATGVRMKAIYARLQEQGFEGSYSAVRRFVRQLEPLPLDVTVRVERAPGEEAQVDFGYAGYMLDETGQRRKAWAFVMTLAWSRHQYVEFVYDQRVDTWLELHRHAFEFFGGVPKKIVPDNLKAAIVRASWDGTDPQVQWAYRECAEHYGFLIAPCRPFTPQHKGKVERGVDYVKNNFLGGRGELPLVQANRAVREWCLTTAGQRIHGTTKQQPLVCFEQTERVALQPLPDQPYEVATWKRVKLHRDCYVVFENAYYSAPFRYVGQTVLVRGSSRAVKILTTDYELIATHTRAQQPGERVTLVDHLPPYKVEGLLWNAETALARAAEVGPATHQTVEHLLADRVVDPLPKARRLLALAQDYGADRLEAACARALAHDDPAYQTVKRILKAGLDEQPNPTPLYATASAMIFVRPVADLLGTTLQEVAAWQ